MIVRHPERMDIIYHPETEGLSQAVTGDRETGALFPILIMAAGIGVAAIGFYNREKIGGAIALGAGSSAAGAAIVLLVRKLF